MDIGERIKAKIVAQLLSGKPFKAGPIKFRRYRTLEAKINPEQSQYTASEEDLSTHASNRD